MRSSPLKLRSTSKSHFCAVESIDDRDFPEGCLAGRKGLGASLLAKPALHPCTAQASLHSPATVTLLSLAPEQENTSTDFSEISTHHLRLTYIHLFSTFTRKHTTHSHHCRKAVTTARLNFLAVAPANSTRSQRSHLSTIDESAVSAQSASTMEGNGALRRKDTTKGPPLRILSLGEHSKRDLRTHH